MGKSHEPSCHKARREQADRIRCRLGRVVSSPFAEEGPICTRRHIYGSWEVLYSRSFVFWKQITTGIRLRFWFNALVASICGILGYFFSW
ncbi:hypothetical protein CEXT_314881 [Caerostris extrusa]|uniref:Uncharacterized protein n=1 Tax=Caerostris extrusa TaxID=172846 RepID=A0AAV4U3I7_CAEEX|nr:hypothetical protein CEXT_314881 [Caerostris extrusa]